MRKLRAYDVLVSTTIEWEGNILAASRAEAQDVARSQLHDGKLDRCGKEVIRIRLREVRP